MKRYPSVADQFYQGDPQKLSEEVRKHIEEGAVRSRVIGVVSPHAGFVYSGDVAGAVYSRIEIPETVILIGPNHTGAGQRVSVMTEGTWSMPFGELEIDRELAEAICSASPSARSDPEAHLYEHSIETQLPFLQYFRKEFQIVPICLMRCDLAVCRELAQAIVKALSGVERSALLVASSDMTHYESHDSACRKDRLAIEQILRCDAEGLEGVVHENSISMCGVNPVTVMLMAANGLGAEKAELVRYMTSGEVSGDMDHVVGYAGMVVQ
jgi:AmmeMemoRadiSam system protein B